jgi:dihydroneopterin aldolase
LTDVPQLISDSSFQTIESLLAWLVDELRDQFFTKEADDESWIRLRISKPQAVPFADAPAVEIMRPVRVE